jgi:GNAT superfamily N-acetyltransferase
MLNAATTFHAHELDFRPFRPGDEQAILTLFQAAFGKPMSKDYWNWRYRDNPIDAPMIELAWDGDTLAAHYAVSPMPLMIGRDVGKAALSMTTMTHPDYQGMGLFPQLAERLYDRLAKQGYRMVFGFPNSNSHRGFVQNLGWEDMAPVPQMSAAIDDMKFPDTPGRSFAQVDRFSDWLPSIAPSPAKVSLGRDIAYYNWRMLEDPENDYRIGVAGGAGGLGLAVFKRHEDAVDIVELAATPETVGALIGSVAAIAQNDGATRLNMWLPVFDPMFPAVEKVGFRPGGPVTYMGGRVFGSGGDLLDSRAWSVRMVMSDVF